MTKPRAVLFDAGGVFLLPQHERIIGAFSRADVVIAPEGLDDAHYRAAARFTTEVDVEADWVGSWRGYLDAYVDACGVTTDDPGDVHLHLDSEFADAALWLSVAPGCREGLRAVAETGVLLGVVSNADGMMGNRLRELEILISWHDPILVSKVRSLQSTQGDSLRTRDGTRDATSVWHTRGAFRTCGTRRRPPTRR